MTEFINTLTINLELSSKKRWISPSCPITQVLYKKLLDIKKLPRNKRLEHLKTAEPLVDEARIYCAHEHHEDVTTMVMLAAFYRALIQSSRDDYYKLFFNKLIERFKL